MSDMLSGPSNTAGGLLLGYQVEAEGPCPHCNWLGQELERAKGESARLANQVLALVQQKLSLSQQVDAWEVGRTTHTIGMTWTHTQTPLSQSLLHSVVHYQMDVAAMVEGNISKQLQQDQRKSTRRQPNPAPTTTRNSSQKSWTSMLRSAFS